MPWSFTGLNSVKDVTKKVATEFCEKSTEFKGLLGKKIWTLPDQREFTDQFIRTAVECSEEEYTRNLAAKAYDETKSAAKAFKWAMLYIAYIIAESSLVHHNAKAPPDERTENLSDILNDACDECDVKPNVHKLQESLLRIVKFVSTKSVEIYNQGRETRRLAAEKERAEAEKERAEAEKERAEAEEARRCDELKVQITKGKENAELMRSSSVERLPSLMSDWKGVLPSGREEDMPTKILPKTNPNKIRVIRFVQMLLEILEARKAQITTVNAFEEFFKQLFVAWLKNVAGYDKFTSWMATNHFKINLDTLDPCETYYYLQKWNKYVKLIVEEDKKNDIDIRATAVYNCPAWLLVNHITFDQVLFALSQTDIYDKKPLLTHDGNTIVWSKLNFNSFEKFNFKENESVASARRRRQGQYDDN